MSNKPYMPFITVEHTEWIGKPYFTTAKCAVYGRGRVTGTKYKELQRLINGTIRLEGGRLGSKNVHPYLVWGEYAPAWLPGLYEHASFSDALTKYMYLTQAGKKRLQEVLVEHYGPWMKDPEFSETQ